MPNLFTARVRRIAAAAVAAALVASGLVLAAYPADAAAKSWSATSTKALELTHATLLTKHASNSRQLRLTVGLAPRDRAGLQKLISRQDTRGSGVYGKYLTPAQFTARYAATKSSANAVRTYLRSQGMRNLRLAGNRLQITATATVAQAEKAFHTNIAAYRRHGRRVLANTAPAMVPSALRGKVNAVLGLSTLGFTADTPTVPKLTGYYPAEFNKVYDAGTTKAGTKTKMAVIAEGDVTQTIKDLRLAESKQHLRTVPVSVVYTGPKSTDTSGVDEWNLDTQTSTGVAPNVARLLIYVASSLTNADLARAINTWVTQDSAQAASASLGECDALPFLDGSMLLDDMALAEAAAQGQTFMASTGDTGSSCAVAGTNGVPGSGAPDTEYPASSPYTLAVGGTTLDTDDADNYGTEIAWNAGGGGASPVENGGAWQSGAVPTSAAGVRGVPDIALDADPDTGALIYVDGAVEQIGGTSLSSPMALGMWTRLQSSNKRHLGFAPPKLYALYAKAQDGSPLPPSAVPGFHDIVVGGNGAYVATPGWDYTTGLGSFDLNALNTALK
ncbi:MAG TPA: S53 family peptidase [Jatrophihabitantaceae bacterium]|jgi:subtilase family serine protease|nr:S53 family peptidase [Jatrophihabitantaceae bacterium]